MGDIGIGNAAFFAVLARQVLQVSGSFAIHRVAAKRSTASALVRATWPLVIGALFGLLLSQYAPGAARNSVGFGGGWLIYAALVDIAQFLMTVPNGVALSAMHFVAIAIGYGLMTVHAAVGDFAVNAKC